MGQWQEYRGYAYRREPHGIVIYRDGCEVGYAWTRRAARRLIDEIERARGRG